MITKHKKKFSIKKYDKVLVRAGKHKGAVGEVLKVDKDKDRIVVSGVNVVKRHQKPNQLNPDGVVTKTKSIHISNVSLFIEGKDGKKIPSKVKILNEDGKKKRVLKKNNKEIEEFNYAK